jgi:hypothetical protein
MTKHTPGPWTTGEPYLKLQNGKPWFVRQIMMGMEDPSDDQQIALVHAFEDYERDSECEANARLIAAAPDLLRACKRALEEYQVSRNGASAYSDELLAAIKKAELG